VAYTTVDEVQTLIRWVTFTGSTVLTTVQLEQLITETSAKIDGILATIYEVPITAAVDLGIIGYIAVRLAAYETAKIIILQAGGDIPAIVASWRDDAERLLQQLLEQEIMLSETPISRAEGGMYSHTAHSPEAPERRWSFGKEQWS